MSSQRLMNRLSPEAKVCFDPADFIKTIITLGAFGCGGGPESAMAGVLNALDKLGLEAVSIFGQMQQQKTPTGSKIPLGEP
jgi:hypothetical protein